MKNLSFLLVTMFFAALASAQNWEIYEVGNSEVLNNKIEALEVDNDGNLWVSCGYFGLTKFDGTTWETFDSVALNPDCNIYVTDITADPNSADVWMTTFNSCGLLKYNNGIWTSTGFVFNHGMACVEVADDGTVWVGNNQNGGLYEYDGTAFTGYDENNSDNPNDYVHGIGLLNDSERWVIGTHEIGLMLENSWEIFPPLNYNQHPFYSMVTDVAVQNDSITWFAHSHGLSKYNRNTATWLVFKEDNSPIIPMANGCEMYDRTMAIDDMGRVFISNACDGMLMFDEITWTSFNTTNSDIPSDLINTIEVDEEQNIWVGTKDGGIGKLTLPIAVNIQTPTFSSPNVFPNPCHDFLTIETENSSQSKLRLIDIQGRTVLEESFQKTTQISVKYFPKGFYYLRIDEAGQSSFEKIFIE